MILMKENLYRLFFNGGKTMNTCQNYNYDTDIEELFFEKVNEIKNKELREKIKISWLNDKGIYTSLTDKIEYEFIHYSLHDDSHSKCILEYIFLLLGEEKIKQFSVGDLWLLLEAAYSHDIGMFVTYDELKEIWQDDKTIKKIIRKVSMNSDKNAIQVFNRLKCCIDEQISDIDNPPLKENHDFIKSHPQWPLEIRKAITLINSEYVRMKHPERSQNKIIDLLEKFEYLNMEKRLYKIVGKIDYLHGQDFSKVKQILECESLGFSTDLIHPRMIALLLRIGDVLDVRNNRFDYWNIKYFGGLPEDSEEHFEKHRSVTEFLINEETVQIHMESDKIKTCVASRAWLDLVEKEMDHYICYWNAFAPDELKGVKLKKVDLLVLYKDQKFILQDFRDNLKADPDKLLRLLTGRNFYGTNLVAFREILQNAIDATKMKIAAELYKDKTYWINKEITDFKSIKPYDIQSQLFENNDITIKVNYAHKNGYNDNKSEHLDENTIVFEIIDKGIGMDKDGLEALFHIGTGWRRRENISELMEVIPGWLVPTGGFGIGILSTFLLSDKVVFETKSLQSPQYQMTVYSPSKGGAVEKVINRNYYSPTGTTVRFEVSTAKVLEELHNNVEVTEDVKKKLENLNILNNMDRIHIVMLLLQSLLQSLFVDYIFPIHIKSDQFQYDKMLKGYKVNEIFKTINGSIFKGKLNFVPEFLQIQDLNCFWDNERNILVRFKAPKDIINNSDKENTKETTNDLELITRIGYKGIIVDNKNIASSITDKNVIKFCNMYFESIDIFERNVDNILEISRNHFAYSYNIENVIRTMLFEYFNKIRTQITKLISLSLDDNSKNIIKLASQKFQIENLALYFNYNVHDINSHWNKIENYFEKDYEYLTIDELLQKKTSEYLNPYIEQINTFLDTLKKKRKLLDGLSKNKSNAEMLINELKEFRQKGKNVVETKNKNNQIEEIINTSNDLLKNLDDIFAKIKSFMDMCVSHNDLFEPKQTYLDDDLNALQDIMSILNDFNISKSFDKIDYVVDRKSLRNKLLYDKIVYCNNFQYAIENISQLIEIDNFKKKMFYFKNEHEILSLDLLTYPHIKYEKLNINHNNKTYYYYKISYNEDIQKKIKPSLVDIIVNDKLYQHGKNYISVGNIDYSGYEVICVKNPLDFDEETQESIKIIYNPFFDGINYGQANIRKIISDFDLNSDIEFNQSYIRRIYDESQYFNHIVDFVYHLNNESSSIEEIKNTYCKLVYEVIEKIKSQTNQDE